MIFINIISGAFLLFWFWFAFFYDRVPKTDEVRI